MHFLELLRGRQEIKGEHFMVYSSENNIFYKEVSRKAEIYYQRIAYGLGYGRHSGFWTWDNSVKIFIYHDRDSYLKASGQPEWSQGSADYKNKTISSCEGSTSLIGSVLPHEIAHLIFKYSMEFKDNVPIWLDEGVAQWEESDAARHELLTKAKELYEKDTLLSIKGILRLNIKFIDKNGKRFYFRTVRTKEGALGIVVLSPDVLINTYYIKSGALVGYLIGFYGNDRFKDLCQRICNN